MKNRLLAAVLFLWTAAAAAAEVHGVVFPERTKVGNAELALNGAGVRSRFFIKVYAAGLYVPARKQTAAELLAGDGAKRLRVVTLMDLTAAQFAEALVEGLHKNLPEAEIAPLQARIEQFRQAVLNLKAAPKGTTIDIDWLPGSGTRLGFNGEKRGEDIDGEDFYRALLLIWLGERPAESSLKDALLGR